MIHHPEPRLVFIAFPRKFFGPGHGPRRLSSGIRVSRASRDRGADKIAADRPLDEGTTGRSRETSRWMFADRESLACVGAICVKIVKYCGFYCGRRISPRVKPLEVVDIVMATVGTRSSRLLGFFLPTITYIFTTGTLGSLSDVLDRDVM